MVTAPFLTDMTPTPEPTHRVSASAGHLSVHLDSEHPPEVPFSFERQPKRLSSAVGVSMAAHGAVLLLVLILMQAGVGQSRTPAVLPEVMPSQIVWLNEPGPGGGGGGGGNQMQEPPRVVELKGEDKISVPVAPPIELEIPKPDPEPEPEPVPQVNIPAMTLAAALESMPGVIEAPPGPPSLSQGSGRGGGAGTGTGTGIGSGTGSGLGPGYGGGTGGGAYRPGNDVSMPQPIYQPKPAYTSDAMRQRIEGEVWLECVVNSNGTVGQCSVTKSLDGRWGLDDEAVKAARLWRFRPGTRRGEPVPVLVGIAMEFSIR
jgi:TonB family protein